MRSCLNPDGGDASVDISVIMPSYLGDYPGCAIDREAKFIRAVRSFLRASSGLEAELIIVADGCEITERLYWRRFSLHKSIRFASMDKQPLFSGRVRQQGLDMARGRWIAYLDSDDYFGRDHLRLLKLAMDSHTDCEWLYYDDATPRIKRKWMRTYHKVRPRLVELRPERIGTSAIVHRNSRQVQWGDGYGHDWRLIESMLSLPHAKIAAAQYMVCHIPGEIDA